MKRKFLISLFCVLIAVFSLPFVVFAASETESNDTCATATSISVNQDVTGNLSNNGDVDWYKFSITGSGYVTIDFTHTNLFDSGEKWRVTLYQSNGTTKAAGGDVTWSVYGNSNMSTPRVGIPAGTYYIKIERGYYYSDWSDAQYTLKVNYTATTSYEKERNDSASIANTISTNTNYYGSTSNSSDVDWYKFTTTSDGYVTIDFTHNDVFDSGDKWKVTLYKSDGTTKATGGDVTWYVSGSSSLSTPKIGIPAGTYYVKIERGYYYSDWSDVLYTLKVNYTVTSNYEKETNDSASNANTISTNTNYYGSTTNSGDVDWYKFTITSNGYVTIDFAHDDLFDSGEKWRLALYQSNGTTIAIGGGGWWPIYGNSDLSTSKIGIPAGTYYAKIERGSYSSDWSDALYTLKINYTSSNSYETEINDSAAQADNISVNTNCYGVTFHSDVDWYSVNVTNPGYYQFKFNHNELNSADTYWYMYIYKSDGTTKVFSSDRFSISGNGTSYTTDETYLNSGKYFIKIAPYSTSRFSESVYTIRVCNNNEPSRYTVSYNANGGSGAPDSQIVDAGSSMTISSTVPERFGYTFLGWNTSSSASAASYIPGRSFTPTGNTTLYAVWQAATTISSGVTNSSYSASITFADGYKFYSFTPSATAEYRFESTGSVDSRIYVYNASGEELAYDDDAGEGYNFLLDYNFTAGTKYYIKIEIYDIGTGTVDFTVKKLSEETDQYTVSYNANGGSGAPDFQIVDAGSSVTIRSAVPERFGHTFLGWSKSSSATTATYIPGQSFTPTGDTTLYAVWQTANVISSGVTDGSYSASIPFSFGYKFFSFTPSATAEYSFESTGSVDSRIYVYNASGEQLAYNDDAGEGYNFLLDYNFTAGTKYYIRIEIFSSGTGTVNFTVKKQSEPIQITTQPKTVYAISGKKVSTSVTASGEGLTYQWYYKKPNMMAFAKSSITTSTYTVTMSEGYSGTRVYCYVTDKYGNKVKTDTVYLRMSATITKQPADVPVAVGQKATTSVTAIGEELTYQWYYKKVNMTAFAKSSIITNTYSVTINSDYAGCQIYCVVTDKYGKKATSKTVTIGYTTRITTQPKTTYAKSGEKAKATIEASGDGLTYQWYYKKTSMTNFAKSSITSATYSVTMNEGYSGTRVYCYVTDKYGNKVKSDTVYLRMAATITGQPTGTTVKSGEKAKASVTAIGEGLTYQWYYKKTNMTDFAKSSITTNTYSVTMNSGYSGCKIYCVVTDKYGKKDTSKTVTLSMKAEATELKITGQPKTTYATSGAKAKTTVTAVGDGLTYQWYYKKSGMDSFAKSSITSATYSVTMNEGYSDTRVYCYVTDKYGNKVKSDTVYLRMAVTITKQPTNASAASGSKAKTTVTAVGDGLSYQWYYKKVGQSDFSKSSIVSATYSVTMNEGYSGCQIYCIIIDMYGKSAKTNTVTLTMS